MQKRMASNFVYCNENQLVYLVHVFFFSLLRILTYPVRYLGVQRYVSVYSHLQQLNDPS